jgi:Fe2+ or Zn2+ uptake regulation protein
MSQSNSAFVAVIINRFTERHIRLTPQRISVYKFLLENHNHPTVDMVYSSLKSDNPSLSKTTIYNTVDTLVSAGLIRTIRSCDGEARLDGVVDIHGHFICKKCGNISDFSLDGCEMPDSLNTFMTDDYEIRATGTCPECLNEHYIVHS